MVLIVASINFKIHTSLNNITTSTPSERDSSPTYDWELSISSWVYLCENWILQVYLSKKIAIPHQLALQANLLWPALPGKKYHVMQQHMIIYAIFPTVGYHIFFALTTWWMFFLWLGIPTFSPCQRQVVSWNSAQGWIACGGESGLLKARRDRANFPMADQWFFGEATGWLVVTGTWLAYFPIYWE